MREILSYFLRSEESMNNLLLECDKNKWKQGLVYWASVAVLLGFLTMAAYRLNGIEIIQVIGVDLREILQNSAGVDINEGIIWLVSAFISIAQSLITVGFKFLIWGCTLYIATLILKDRVGIYQIVLLSMFSMLTWLSAQVIGVIAVMIVSICSVEIINEMALGISMILEYWYLILLAIGYSIAARCTFFKAGAVILIIQAIYWGISSAIPALQGILG